MCCAVGGLVVPGEILIFPKNVFFCPLFYTLAYDMCHTLLLDDPLSQNKEKVNKRESHKKLTA